MKSAITAADVHEQCGICFLTPPFCDRFANETVMVSYFLQFKLFAKKFYATVSCNNNRLISLKSVTCVACTNNCKIVIPQFDLFLFVCRSSNPAVQVF